MLKSILGTRMGMALAIAGMAWTAVTAGAAAGNPKPKGGDTVNFGFSGPESYPIDPFISELLAADFDGDGLTDLMVVNNSRSKINILFNRTGRTNDTREVDTSRNDLNELPPDARFKIDSIASEKRIAALVVADLNGDK